MSEEPNGSFIIVIRKALMKGDVRATVKTVLYSIEVHKKSLS